ncbi:MAG: hypothetical protein WED83_00935 [Acidimicrobiia bacterium]
MDLEKRPLPGLGPRSLLTVRPVDEESGFVAPSSSFQRDVEAKIIEARRLLNRRGIDIPIDVDGELDPETITRTREAGADVFVSGSWILKHPAGL